MEFGIFLNGYIPGPAAHQTEMEHTMLMREAEYVIFADKHNWKSAWLGEHHALTEYSHMSAPEVVMGYIAAQTDYIHLSSGINSLSPRKEHPVRYAERAAMLDHFTNNRFEWGTGRGAGSHELASFNIMDKNSTKAEWEEVVREIPRMWEQVDYTFDGESFTVPTPQDAITWPRAPLSMRDLAAGDEDALLDGLIEAGYLLCGTPDEVSEQIAAWGDVGMDQLVFGLPIEGMHHDEVLACLELF